MRIGPPATGSKLKRFPASGDMTIFLEINEKNKLAFLHAS